MLFMTCQAQSRYGHVCRDNPGHRGSHSTWTDGSTRKADHRWTEDVRQTPDQRAVHATPNGVGF